MKVIVESGATKSEWRVIGTENHYFLPGMNVSSMPMDAVRSIIGEGLSRIDGAGQLEGFYLYTAGVVTQEIHNELTSTITESAPHAAIDIQNDLMGACRAAWGRDSGLVAILGTGSNTGFYDGSRVNQKVMSGGYILGDEGSASVLGRLFISDLLKFAVPGDIADDFNTSFSSSYESIIHNVYAGEAPSRYLGSLAPFIMSRYDTSDYIRNLVDGNFRAFVEKSLMKYEVDTYPVAILGGFGCACSEVISRIFSEYGIRISSFIKTPIEGLVKYHTDF